MVLDMEEGTLSFIVEGTYLGVAHTGLKGKKLHIIVSAVWGHCEITMRYLASLDPGPVSLMSMARLRIRQSLATVTKEKAEQDKSIDELTLPRSMKNYLKYEECFVSDSKIEEVCWFLKMVSNDYNSHNNIKQFSLNPNCNNSII